MDRTVIRHDMDRWFTIVAETHGHGVGFKVYPHEGQEDRADGLAPLFHEAGADHRPAAVEKLEESTPWLTGSVKWDGCSDWNFGDDGYLHGCSREDLAKVGDMLAACWDLAGELGVPTEG